MTLLAGAVFDLVYPERCALCGAERMGRPWCSKGIVVAGLRAWDEPHLCRDCLFSRRGDIPRERVISLGGREVPVLAAAATGPELVRLVGAWKYHGLRGLAWPMAELVFGRMEAAGAYAFADALLVPVPLHRARRRMRGFNQAEVLARLLAARGRAEVATDLLQRGRATGQQAKLSAGAGRAGNVRGAFRCTGVPERVSGRPLYLVDDLVTSGATVAAVAEPLERAGFRIEGILAIGVARRPEVSVETTPEADKNGVLAGDTPGPG